MKTIIISEEMERKLFQYYINEAISDGDIRMEVLKYLDGNFVRADKTILNKNGQQESAFLLISNYYFRKSLLDASRPF